MEDAKGRLAGRAAIVKGALAASIASVPLGRMGDPEADIGRVVAFLASDEAAYLIGGTLALDGRRTFVR
jgi:NAD(P)-dependent dehydrogenase (short-subunit alcohol dehydrogenase family)